MNLALGVLYGALLAAIGIPNMLRAAEQAGTTAGPLAFLIVGLIACIPVGVALLLNGGLLRLKQGARIWQILLSALGVLVFPVGTVLNAIALYYMLFDAKTKAAFGTS